MRSAGVEAPRLGGPADALIATVTALVAFGVERWRAAVLATGVLPARDDAMCEGETMRVGRGQVVVAALTTGAMVATPFAAQGGASRRACSTATVVGLLATTAFGSARRWGGRRIGLATAAVTGATGLVEAIGVRTGRPFGRYAYTDALRPQIGAVPVIVPMAWMAMAVPAREAAHAALGTRSTPFARIVCGAAALTAWDLFLDPQMVGEGYWRWAAAGRFRGIPLSNFGGWFAVGLVVMAVLEIALPPAEPAPDLVAAYGAMAAMETAAFATFLRDGRVAVVGGFGMLPVAALALARLVGQRT